MLDGEIAEPWFFLGRTQDAQQFIRQARVPALAQEVGRFVPNGVVFAGVAQDIHHGEDVAGAAQFIERLSLMASNRSSSVRERSRKANTRESVELGRFPLALVAVSAGNGAATSVNRPPIWLESSALRWCHQRTAAKTKALAAAPTSSTAATEGRPEGDVTSGMAVSVLRNDRCPSEAARAPCCAGPAWSRPPPQRLDVPDQCRSWHRQGPQAHEPAIRADLAWTMTDQRAQRDEHMTDPRAARPEEHLRSGGTLGRRPLDQHGWVAGAP